MEGATSDDLPPGSEPFEASAWHFRHGSVGYYGHVLPGAEVIDEWCPAVWFGDGQGQGEWMVYFDDGCATREEATEKARTHARTFLQDWAERGPRSLLSGLES